MARLRVPYVIHWAGTPRPDLSGFIEPIRVPFRFVPRAASHLAIRASTAQAQEAEPEEPNRGLFEEFVDPLGPMRATAYYSIRAQLRRLEPDNRQLSTLTGPNYLPSQADLDTMLGEIAAARTRAAARIANGHAFEQHGNELAVKDRVDFQAAIKHVLDGRASLYRELRDGRSAFYEPRTNTIVIVNPNSPDSGTAFKPGSGIEYFRRID